MNKTLYKTKLGRFLIGESIDLIESYVKKYYRKKIQLIITSPPFPLNNKKNMGTYREVNTKNGS